MTNGFTIDRTNNRDLHVEKHMIGERQQEKEYNVAHQDIIGIINDQAWNIKECDVIDPNFMYTSIIRQEITADEFEFKHVLFHMIQAIKKYPSIAIDDPHLHLKQFLEVASNFKIPKITCDACNFIFYIMS